MAPLRTGDGFADVVVTAVVSTTSLAANAEETWQSLLEGRSGIRELDYPFVAEFKSPVRIGGPLQENFDEHLNRVELRRLSYMQKMSLVLGRRLWETAGTPEIDTRRLTVSIGLALGITEEIPRAVRRLAGEGPACGVSARSADVHAQCARRRGGIGSSGQGGDHLAGNGRRLRRRSHRPRPGGNSCSVRPTSRSVAASRRRSRRCPSRRSGRRGCCRRTTTIRPAPAARSTRIATAWCSVKAAR